MSIKSEQNKKKNAKNRTAAIHLQTKSNFKIRHPFCTRSVFFSFSHSSCILKKKKKRSIFFIVFCHIYSSLSIKVIYYFITIIRPAFIQFPLDDNNNNNNNSSSDRIEDEEELQWQISLSVGVFSFSSRIVFSTSISCVGYDSYFALFFFSLIRPWLILCLTPNMLCSREENNFFFYIVFCSILAIATIVLAFVRQLNRTFLLRCRRRVFTLVSVSLLTVNMSIYFRIPSIITSRKIH